MLLKLVVFTVSALRCRSARLGVLPSVLVLTSNLEKRDAEIKLLLGCSASDQQAALAFRWFVSAATLALCCLVARLRRHNSTAERPGRRRVARPKNGPHIT